MFNIKCVQQSLINTKPLLLPVCWGEQRPFTPERLMLGVKWFHTHTRILHVTTATTPPAATTPASWFIGCWECDGIGGEEEGRDAVLSYDNAVPPYSHKWREWERVRNGKLSREQSRLSLPCTDVGVIFLLFSVTWTFCFSQTALHADRMVIFIVIIALNLHVHLWKGSDAWCNSSES